MQSHLEEGEIPEFEVPSSVSTRNKERMLLGSQNGQSLTLLNAHDKNKNGPKRYGSPPSEGEYISEEEKLAWKNSILQKPMCKNNFMGKAPKNLHPMQPTYGSVEVIMTKIGESLGRRGNYYYTERRSKESRYLIAINDSRNINSVLRKTSPALKRFGYNYYSKRRHSETNSESVNNIREKYGKMKSKQFFDARRSGKGVRKKRKREHSDISEVNTDEVDKFKKLRLFEEKEKGMGERNKKLKKHGLDTRLFKEIPLPQEQEPDLEQKNVKQLPNSKITDCLLDNPKDSSSDMVEESDLVEPDNTVLLEGGSAAINSTDKPEQLNGEEYDNNGEDDDDDDDDEETELIKLRLLALTSNKKKNQSFTNSCLHTEKNLEKDVEENSLSESKSNEAYDKKTIENPSSINDEIVNERRFDNEIDRYELFLRAEALKTALLKKHQRILKKRKNFSAISRKGDVIGSENSNGNNLVKRYEIDIDIISDEELLEKNQDSDLYAQLEVKENYDKLEVKDVSKSDSKSIKEDKNIDIHREDELHSKNTVAAVTTGHSEKNSFHAEIITPESDKALNNVDKNLTIAPAGTQSVKKKARRIRLKQVKKSVDSNETNISNNNRSCQKEDVNQETKLGYTSSLSDKRKLDLEKKFVLVDTVATSNPEINAANSISNSELSLDAKKNHKSIITPKPITLHNEEPAAKIPESERIIVHLGSDSSDEECVPHVHPDKKSHPVVNVVSEEVDPLVSVENEDKIKEFEKSVELLLRGARRKLENRAELISEIPATHEAVYSHLAPSQRLEYIRLKQKIAEREKLGKAEKNSLNSPTIADRSKSRANTIEDKRISPIIIQRNIGKRPIFGQNVKDNNKALIFKNGITNKESKNPPDKNYAIRTPNYGGFGNSKSIRVSQFSKIKKPVPEPNLQRGSTSTLKKHLTDSNSKNTIKKGPAEIIIERKKMLNQNRLHLERLKILWKNIKIEKMVEAKYEREIKKLKIQQNFFELKINQQRLKIKRMADESKQIYEAFQKNNKRVEVYSKKKRINAKTENEEKKAKDSDKATAENNGANDKESGKDVTKEVIPNRVENDVRLIAKDTQIGVNEKRGDKETITEEKVYNENKCDGQEAVTVADKEWLKEYKSPLDNVTKRSESSDCPRIDPNVIMCQFDLLGKCNDEECVFQHWRA